MGRLESKDEPAPPNLPSIESATSAQIQVFPMVGKIRQFRPLQTLFGGNQRVRSNSRVIAWLCASRRICGSDGRILCSGVLASRGVLGLGQSCTRILPSRPFRPLSLPTERSELKE